MNIGHRGKRVKKTKLPIGLYAYALIAIMWVAILAAVFIDNTPTQQESTPQQTPDITIYETPVEHNQPMEAVTLEPDETPKVVEQEPETTQEPIEVVEEIPEPVQEAHEPEVTKQPGRRYFECPLSEKLQDYMYDRMEQFNINLDLAWYLAIVWNESRFDQYAIGEANDSGYAQLIPGTYRETYGKLMAAYPELDLVDDVCNAYTNLACGLYYMRIIADQDNLGEINEGNIHHILTCYNKGPGGGQKHFKEYGTWEGSYSKRIAAIAAIIIADGSTANINM